VDGFRYGDSIVELGETGVVWTEEAFVGYVQDPTGWLREALDNNRARGKMAYRVREKNSKTPVECTKGHTFVWPFFVAKHPCR